VDATIATPVDRLLAGSAEHLLAAWDGDRRLLPFSSRLVADTIVHRYDHPIAVRYTVNSLLGLLAAARASAAGPSEEDVVALVEAFLERPERITSPADRGLATLLVSTLSPDRATVAPWVRRLAADVRLAGLDMQALAWVLWGAAAARRAGAARGADVAHCALERIVGELVDRTSGLPRHSARAYRRNIVSFGSLTYFLRAMHEAADVLHDRRARALFDGGVAHAAGLQGPRGEWPWMINCRTGAAFDRYPVFAVHQDSMAMLFLHPAQERGTPGAGEAVRRSLQWVLGANELDLCMFVERPFFAYRSIERAERAPRLRRYARALRGSAATDAGRVRVNRECRSYHLGWLLYVWSTAPRAA
jgi:hypothetical protein